MATQNKDDLHGVLIVRWTQLFAFTGAIITILVTLFVLQTMWIHWALTSHSH